MEVCRTRQRERQHEWTGLAAVDGRTVIMSPPSAAPIWRNWHETVSQPIRRFEVGRNGDESQSTIAQYNATASRLRDLIREATDTGVSLRAVGGGWSFTRVAATDGILLDTQRLNYRFNLGPEALAPGYDASIRPVLLQCGISIADVNKYLARRGQALRTSGASNGQTIAGALGTGTHGGAIDVGAVQDYVVGIHIAATPDETLWLERSERRVLSDTALTALGARRINDDELFDAARVSFGSFGLVLGVVIEPDPLYFLHAFRDRVTLNPALWDAVQTMQFGGASLPGPAGRRPYHLELNHNPYESADAAMATVMLRESQKPPGAKAPKLDGGIGKGDSLLDAIGVVTDTWDGVTPFAALVFKAAYQAFPKAGFAGTPGEMFKDTSTRGRSASSAMGLPLEHAQAALQLAREAVLKHQAPALVAMRFVKAGRSTLGFTMHEPVTCILEVDGAHSDRTFAAQAQTWRVLEQKGIPYTFHWGKMNDLDAVRVRARWGTARVQQWVAARQRILPTDAARRVFANAFTLLLDL